MKLFILGISATLLFACSSTNDNRSTGPLHLLNLDYIKEHKIDIDTQSAHLSQCRMADSDVVGVIRPIHSSVTPAKEYQNGLVKMAFSIMPNGTLDNFVIVEANPKRIYDRQARRTLQKVVCEPVLKNGKAIQIDHQLIALHFDHTSQS